MKRQHIQIEETANTKVRNAVKTNRFHKKDERTPEERDKAQKADNQDRFFTKYPGLSEELITNMDQFDPNYKNKMVNILKNPDMSFCNFFISFCMFVISLITFYSHRDFNNEYFNRQLIYKKLVNNPLGYQNYGEIKSVEDFKFFLNETMAWQIFEPTQARLNPGDEGFNEDYKSSYIF